MYARTLSKLFDRELNMLSINHSPVLIEIFFCHLLQHSTFSPSLFDPTLPAELRYTFPLAFSAALLDPPILPSPHPLRRTVGS